MKRSPAPGSRPSCRTVRRGRKSPKAASRFGSSPNTSRPATSRPPSPSWSRASARASATRCSSASPARARPITVAKVIEAVQRPALVLAPNKTLAAQLYGEFKAFFPDNAVEYFVSYYDYYQPEAYVPRSDTYIEKESSINEQIDRMRHAATRALLERDDVIIVASVSCIYGIGSVETYSAMTFDHFNAGDRLDRSSSSSPIWWPCNTSAMTAQLHPRHVPGARRYGRNPPGPPGGPGPGASLCSATRSTPSPSSIPLTGRQDRPAFKSGQGLRQLALCDAQARPSSRR